MKGKIPCPLPSLLYGTTVLLSKTQSRIAQKMGRESLIAMAVEHLNEPTFNPARASTKTAVGKRR